MLSCAVIAQVRSQSGAGCCPGHKLHATRRTEPPERRSSGTGGGSDQSLHVDAFAVACGASLKRWCGRRVRRRAITPACRIRLERGLRSTLHPEDFRDPPIHTLDRSRGSGGASRGVVELAGELIGNRQECEIVEDRVQIWPTSSLSRTVSLRMSAMSFTAPFYAPARSPPAAR